MASNKVLEGTMTWDEFLHCALELVQKSKEANDNWKLLGNPDKEYCQYLLKRERHVINNSKSCNDTQCIWDASEPENEFKVVYNFEYHVVYNISYMVPVLCFNASKYDGSLLTLDELWSALGFNSGNNDMFTTLTQMDHPILQRPFLTIHPCRTQELLRTLTNSKNLLISFISSFGPYIGLHCNILYGVT